MAFEAIVNFDGNTAGLQKTLDNATKQVRDWGATVENLTPDINVKINPELETGGVDRLQKEIDRKQLAAKLQVDTSEAVKGLQKLNKELNDTFGGVISGFDQQVKQSTAALEAQRKVVAQIAISNGKNSEAYKKQFAELVAIRKEALKYENAITAVDNELNASVKSLKQINAEQEQAAKSAGKLADQQRAQADALKAFATGEILGGLSDFLGTAAERGETLTKAMRSLKAQTGATAAEMEQLGERAEVLYSSGGVGQDLADTVTRLAQAQKLLGDTLAPDDLDAFVAGASAISELNEEFGSFEEITRKAAPFIKNFGITGQEAFELIALGSREANTTQNDFLDTIGEYSGLLSEAGFSATDFINVLRVGGKEGAFNLDKIADSIKETQIALQEGDIDNRLKELTGAIPGALSAQLNAIVAQAKSGEISVRDLITTSTEAIQNADLAPALTARVQNAIGRTPAEDLGKSLYKRIFEQPLDIDTQNFVSTIENQFGELPAVLGSQLNNIFSDFNAGASGVQELTQQTNQAITTALANGQISTTLAEQIRDGLDVALVSEQAAQSAAEITAAFQTTNPLQPLIRGVETAIDKGLQLAAPYVQAASSVLGSLSQVAPALQFATDNWDSFGNIASKALSNLTSPTGAVIAGIAGISAGLFALYETNDGFREWVDDTWGLLVGVFEEIKPALDDFIDVVVEVGALWFEMLITPAEIAFSVLQTLFGLVVDGVKDFLQWVGVLDDTGDGMDSLTAAVDVLSKSFTFLKAGIAGILGAFQAIKDAAIRVVEAFRGGLAEGFQKLGEEVLSFGENVGNGFVEGVNGSLAESDLSDVFDVIDEKLEAEAERTGALVGDALKKGIDSQADFDSVTEQLNKSLESVLSELDNQRRRILANTQLTEEQRAEIEKDFAAKRVEIRESYNADFERLGNALAKHNEQVQKKIQSDTKATEAANKDALEAYNKAVTQVISVQEKLLQNADSSAIVNQIADIDRAIKALRLDGATSEELASIEQFELQKLALQEQATQQQIENEANQKKQALLDLLNNEKIVGEQRKQLEREIAVAIGLIDAEADSKRLANAKSFADQRTEIERKSAEETAKAVTAETEEAERQRLLSITDDTQRAYETRLNEIRRALDAEKTAAKGNAAEIARAERRALDARAEAYNEYFGTQSTVLQSVNDVFSNLFSGSDSGNERIEQLKEEMQLLQERGDEVQRQFENGEITEQEYNKRAVELARERAALETEIAENKQADILDIEKAGLALVQGLQEQATQAVQANLEKQQQLYEQQLAARQRIAQLEREGVSTTSEEYKAAQSELEQFSTDSWANIGQTVQSFALSAAASFAQMLLSGENAMSGILLIALDALDALVPVLVAQITGVMLASPNPANAATFGAAGIAAAAGLTALLKGLVALARSAVQLADGGFVSGEGTSTSDSIPAWLSNGEFVVNAETTKKNRAALEWVNRTRGDLSQLFVNNSGALSMAGVGADLLQYMDSNEIATRQISGTIHIVSDNEQRQLAILQQQVKAQRETINILEQQMVQEKQLDDRRELRERKRAMLERGKNVLRLRGKK